MKNYRGLKVLALALALSLAGASTARATELSILGGISASGGAGTANYGSISPLLGGELTWGLGDIFEMGAFYDHNILSFSDGTSGTLRFFGGVARLGFGPLSGFFLDLKIGLCSTSETGVNIDSAFGLGGGLGYRFTLAPFASIAPRIGVRSLPLNSGGTSLSRTMWDGGVLLTFGL